MQPVAPEERLPILDILRGFALFGILVINMAGFSLPWAMWPSGEEWFPGKLDKAVEFLINTFGSGKFNSTFSFLFGVGLTIQLERAAARGANFVPVYLRRCALLLLFGALHMFGIWDGDVLHIYAILGVLLIFARRMSDRALAGWIALAMIVPVLWSAWKLIENKPPKHPPAYYSALAREQVKTYAAGSYAQQVALRAREFREMYLKGFGWFALSLSITILLGFYAGRRRIFQNLEEHLPWIRRLRTWCFFLGLATAIGASAIFAVADRTKPTALGLLGGVLFEIQRPVFCLFYLSAITLLCTRAVWVARLRPLALVGRMPLTNYLMQSVLATAVFYSHGLGWYGRYGPFPTLFVSFGIYALQVVYSNWWMERFRFGPLEYVWRWLTYGSAPPLRLPAGAAPVAAD